MMKFPALVSTCQEGTEIVFKTNVLLSDLYRLFSDHERPLREIKVEELCV